MIEWRQQSIPGPIYQISTVLHASKEADNNLQIIQARTCEDIRIHIHSSTSNLCKHAHETH